MPLDLQRLNLRKSFGHQMPSVEFKVVTHKRQRLEFEAEGTRISIRIPQEARKTYHSFNRKLKVCNGHRKSILP